MCEWGTHIPVEVRMPASQSYTGEERRKVVGIDSCIAPLVEALVKGGVLTTGSCCGHGKGLGYIGLSDGRELLVAPDRETAMVAGEAVAMGDEP